MLKNQHVIGVFAFVCQLNRGKKIKLGEKKWVPKLGFEPLPLRTVSIVYKAVDSSQWAGIRRHKNREIEFWPV